MNWKSTNRSRLLLGLLALPGLAQAQVSGNQVTGNARRYRYQQEEQTDNRRPTVLPDRLFLTDSTFVLGANVMQHVRADSYVAVFGLRQEAATVSAAEKRLTARVQRFTGRLRQLGVEGKDVYTDIVTQQRIKDLRPVKERDNNAYINFQAEEYVRGFESTRNIVVSFRRINLLNDMLVAAAADSVFDLVKVDYIVNKPEEVYDNLFKAAAEVIKRKKDKYLLLTAARLRPSAQPYAEQFTSYVPGGQYENYEAVIATPFNYDYRQGYNYKGLRALTTYYYSPPSADGFDRVINPVVVEPAVTYTLAIQVKYTLRK
ncbi:SIMPL domain-containing protein [Hymenobacter properus]|uniref:SIMPL domain-containing protein n=1 Tax=Hymenobacter properus TaxID=2791026 RepID=A0A931BM36_9BACT|nr:SIMPL domain-containing protein [Hymenobacter properus]MBF9141955.1 SIMPL domain-containing protein [Hymenobacter properus]MBR7720762.1 SIMPL domain-containing protein [Microvirga sp. SRT04]